ncbi:TPA: hypothetical protein N0F65_002424 [Lagenidium giganteum]|uniref:m7GpppX diphosphatase n=1 Tax=Lagenidium giganteum TaxID=4803 RepID=A0AAV2YLR1_9STRA|nr:TPA: hypothetical protein N0F65_002424 [Lagenidium giganteum]
MANVLIAVNPLKYLEEPDKQLFIGQPLDRAPPHPYNIAEGAYRQLCAVRAVMQNQSIIISGESGSGKTETSKRVLDFLTTRASHNVALSVTSEDDMEPELTASAPPSSTMALSLSYPNSGGNRKLSPVALGERLMETIPILESFGNAKTHRNHNSSRFGKYMRLQFSTNSHVLCGASIDTYLLEKSRLVNQPVGERNFHIFYELLFSENTDYLTKTLRLVPKAPENYSYLNQSGCLKAEQIDDAANFKNLTEALSFIGISDGPLNQVLRLVAGLLHLGNVQIAEQDTPEGKAAYILEVEASQNAVRDAAEMLGVDQDELTECMLLKRIMTRGSRRGSIYYVKRDARNAIYSRDTIAKTIYEHMFNWLMVKCASALDYDSFRSDVIPYIGVLDIFGFEDFEPKNRNSYEQLLINYANEALQSLFNTCIFEAEQELYRSENIYVPTNHSLSFPFPLPGVPVKLRDPSDESFLNQRVEPNVEIEYSDNRECLNLIASRHGGLFVTIDNVARLPCPSDRKLNERLHTLFKRHPCFPAPHPKDLRDTFMIKHYAGTVTYTITSFIDKNNTIISDQFEELIKKSMSRVLQEVTGRIRTQSQSFMSPASKSNSISSFGGSKRSKGGSSSNLFSNQMKGLTTELEGTTCNFVRCIKPNTQMKPGIFDKPFVVEQLRCSGTVQACEVLRVGLPTRILYAEVVDVYKNLLPADMFQRFDFNEKLFTQAVLWVYQFPTSAYRLGDSRLFFRTGKIDLLDKLLTPTGLNGSELAAQMMRYLSKKRWLNVTSKVIACNSFVKIFHQVKFRRKAIILQCWARQFLARKRVKKLRVQHRISALWNRLANKSRVMHQYQDLPEDKMVLLDKLLKKSYLPPNQRWLLKWLGPLQRVIYLQKLWKKVMIQYLAKRGFIWLYQVVKKKRSVLMVQVQVRVLLAKSRFRRLKQARIARERWQMAYLKVKIFCMFNRELKRIHVVRLENDNSTMTRTLEITKVELMSAQQEVKKMESRCQLLEVELGNSTLEIASQAELIERLERDYEAAQEELKELRQQASQSLLERAIRFFTCSTAVTPPHSPRTSASKKNGYRQRLGSDAEDEEIKAKDADVLWSSWSWPSANGSTHPPLLLLQTATSIPSLITRMSRQLAFLSSPRLNFEDLLPPGPLEVPVMSCHRAIGWAVGERHGNPEKNTRFLHLDTTAVNSVKIVDAGGIAQLVKLVTGGSDVERRYAVEALAKIAFTNGDEVVDAGDIPLLVTLVANGTNDQKEHAASALASIARSRQNGVLPTNGTENQKEKAAEAPGTIAVDDDANVVKIVDAGGICPLVKLVENGTTGQKKYAVRALSMIAGKTDANGNTIGKEGGVRPLVPLALFGTDIQKEYAALALRHVATKSDTNAYTFDVAGGATPLVRLARLQSLGQASPSWYTSTTAIAVKVRPSGMKQPTQKNRGRYNIVPSMTEERTQMTRALSLLLTGVGAGALVLAVQATLKYVKQSKLRDFITTRVLKVTESELAVLGTFRADPEQRPAVLVIQRAMLDSSDLQTLLDSLSLKQILNNDIYSTYMGDVDREYKPFKVNLIFPASQAHIQKHSSQKFHMVVETKELYEQVTLPYIQSIPTAKIEWVYNILDHKTESERIIVENRHPTDGFILLPDFKWTDVKNIDSLYCLAICNDRSVRSLRDLTGAHLPLLRNIRDESLQAIAIQFGVSRTALRIYVHYQPTYYHFHVHFSHVSILHGVQTGKAVLLDDIIHNLANDGSYYRNAPLSYAVGEMQHQALVQGFARAGALPSFSASTST